MQKNRKENETVFENFVVNPLYTTDLKKVLAKSVDQDEITHISPIDQLNQNKQCICSWPKKKRNNGS